LEINIKWKHEKGCTSLIPSGTLQMAKFCAIERNF
jgi:hypothetical protein